MRKLTKNLVDQLELQAELKTNLFTIDAKRIGIYSIENALLKIIDVNLNEYPITERQDIKLCEKFLPLFDTSLRYVALRGGRGSAKSMATAIYLLLIGMSEPLRILCFREVQASIKESVYALLQELIAALGIGQFYESTLTEIRGLNGTLFMFKGLSDLTAASVKSMQGINICWGEEASTLTERSLQVLLPTIREENSRIFYSFNPELDTDAVYQRYVINPPDNCASAEINYKENPFFPSVLEAERTNDEKRLSKDLYLNIWEGKVLPARSGAIYFNEISKAQEEHRITKVVYDPTITTHAIWDLGWADHTAIILVQKTLSEIRIIDYIEDNRKTIEEYSVMLKNKTHITNWGKMYLPHDGAHKSMHTGQSTQELLEKFGWQVEITPNLHIDAGIRAARQMFGKCYFNNDSTHHETNVTRLIECLKRYRYGERPDGSLTGTPVHDENSHAADAFRYVAVLHDKLQTNQTQKKWGEVLNYKKNSLY